MAEIVISKGETSVTIYGVEVDDGFANKIFILTPPSNNPEDGARSSIIVDLLRNTRTIIITGHIAPTSSKTAKEIKDELIYIYNGGGTTGGITLSYDGDDLVGTMEKLAFNHKPSDEPTSPPSDFAKYTVQISFVVGTPRT